MPVAKSDGRRRAAVIGSPTMSTTTLIIDTETVGSGAEVEFVRAPHGLSWGMSAFMG